MILLHLFPICIGGIELWPVSSLIEHKTAAEEVR
jgi:hypothetical protein